MQCRQGLSGGHSVLGTVVQAPPLRVWTSLNLCDADSNLISRDGAARGRSRRNSCRPEARSRRASDEIDELESERRDRAKREYDYFLFVRQWDPAYTDFHESTSGHAPTMEDFTIHGLWPDYDDGTYPSFCSNRKFDPEQIGDLLPQLQAEWPTFAARGGDSFWKHEYEKHGTCATATFADEHDYFAGVLALNKQYNLLSALEAANIYPSATQRHSATDMEAAIESMTQVPDSCIVHCKNGEVDEVDICMDKQNPPQPIACPNKRPNECGDILLRPLGSP